MRTNFRRVALPLCLTVTAVLLSGCEDATSREAAEASRTLDEQRTALAQIAMKAPIPGSEEFAGMRSNLNSTASTLDGLRSGTPGQQGAAQLMASNAYRQLAELDLAEAQEANDAIQRGINELYAQLAATERMTSLADSAEQFAGQLTRDHLDRERANWGARLRNAEDRLNSLATPIGELEDSNRTDSARVDELREEANRLLRRAREMGQIAGQSTLENSVATRRSAERIEYQIAQKEAELSYDLQPQRGWADQQASGFKSIIDTIDAAKRDLAQLERELSDGVIGQAQSNANAYRSSLQSGANDVQALINSTFVPSIDAATAHLDNAISRAGQASSKSSGRGASTPKVAKAQALVMKGEALWKKSRVLSSHAGLMQAIAESNAAGSNASSYRSASQASGAAASEALSNAKAAFTEAQDTLNTAGGGAESNRLNQTIGLALQAMDGMSVDFSSVNATGGSSRPAANRGNASSGGFQSADQLVSFLQGLNATDFTGMKQMLGLLQTDSSQVRQGIAIMNDMFDVMADLEQAMKKVDPSGAMTNQLTQMGNSGQGSLYSSVEMLDQDDDTATIAVTAATPGAPRQELELRRGSNGWIIFISQEQFDALSGGQGMDSPEAMRQARAMVDGFRSLVECIDSGEITNAEEASAAFMEMMMQMMQEQG